MPNIRQPISKPSGQFWILALFLLLLFSTGGASRVDVQSLIILRPLSIVICAIACTTLRRRHLAGRGWLLVSVGGLFFLALLHVIPLPPSLWQALPGRQELVEIERLVGIGEVWRPLTLATANGWHALVALFAPLAIILLGIQLSRDDLFRLLPLLVGLVVLSGLIGLLQAIGDPQGSLYFYRITNNGSAVGLFANRNHAATLLACLLPMLVIFASTARGTADQVRFRLMLAAAIAIVLVPLILVTGSRSGLVSSVIGLAAAGLLFRRPMEGKAVRRGKPNRFKMLPILGGLAAICLGFLTYFFSRAEAVERLFAEPSGEAARTDFWIVSLDLIWKYLPLGSGSGSYVEAYQIAEPAGLLDLTYLNHAHNDWIEIAVTFGLPGIVALIGALAGFASRSYHLWRREDGKRSSIAFGRMSSAAILILAIASISDYPLRTPIMMGVFAIFILWFTEAGREQQDIAAQQAEG